MRLLNSNGLLLAGQGIKTYRIVRNQFSTGWKRRHEIYQLLLNEIS
jgi:hypothetical protein